MPIVPHVPTFDRYIRQKLECVTIIPFSSQHPTFDNISICRSVFKQPGLKLRPQEDQAGVSLGGGLREQHAVLHQHRAGASPGPVQVRV